MGPATRQPAARIGQNTHLLSGVSGRDDPQQFGDWRALPATHTGAYRLRTTYRGQVYPVLPADAAPGWALDSVSGRMSIRQPVSRAANRAF